MTTQEAIEQGYTKEYIAGASLGAFVHRILVKPETDLDSQFRAYDCDCEEMININGWLYLFEEA